MRHPLIFLAIFLLAATSGSSVGKEKEKSSVYTVEQLGSVETTQVLHARTADRIAGLKEELSDAEAEDDEDQVEDIELLLEMLAFADRWLERALAPSASSREIYDANAYVDRILRTLEDEAEDPGGPGLKRIMRNVIGGYFGLPAPNVRDGKRDQAVGAEQASLEAVNLYAPGRSTYFSEIELAAMSHSQIAALDVSPEHPVWYSRSRFPGVANAFSTFESELRRGITAVLHEKDDLARDRTYPMHSAARVLFLEEIYLSATSAKGTAEDAFGVEWKVKWGDEVAIEPIASQLYLMAGAKATDVTYSNGYGPSAMVLVLLDPEDAEEEREKEKDDERFPTTVEELAADLDEFYGFDIAPYIHSHGTITERNVDSVLRNHPGGGEKKYRKEKMIGRRWVAFKESGIELKPQDFIERHGGSLMSDVVAVNDRAFRGMYLFDLWIANRDVKDDNNKSFFIRSTSGDMPIREYREGHHDLGLSLGSLWSSGEVNVFKTGEAFAKRGPLGKLKFPQATLFRPAAWDAATWADLAWMAERIVAISDAEIRSAVATGGWPDFAQEALAFKLASRRDRIAELFGISQGGRPASPPSMTIPLGSPEEIAAAERRYGLFEGSLANELAIAGKGPRYREKVLIDGQITASRKSAVVRLLTIQRYPSGLATRYSRLVGKAPKALKGIEFEP